MAHAIYGTDDISSYMLKFDAQYGLSKRGGDTNSHVDDEIRPVNISSIPIIRIA